MEALLDTSHDTFAQERAHITLAMLYSLGLRQDELLTLTDADVDYPGREVRVTGKRNKQRPISLQKESGTGRRCAMPGTRSLSARLP